MSRRTLTAETAIMAASDLVDEVSYHGLTLAAVAQRSGVASASLYQHIRGLADLRRQVATRAMYEFGDVLRSAALGKARGEALVAVASAYRRWAREHPGRYTAIMEAADVNNPEFATAAQRTVEVLLAVLEGYGIRGEDAIDAMCAIRSTLHGFVALDSLGSFARPQEMQHSFTRLVTALDSMLQAWDGTPTHPENARIDSR